MVIAYVAHLISFHSFPTLCRRTPSESSGSCCISLRFDESAGSPECQVLWRFRKLWCILLVKLWNTFPRDKRLFQSCLHSLTLCSIYARVLRRTSWGVPVFSRLLRRRVVHLNTRESHQRQLGRLDSSIVCRQTSGSDVKVGTPTGWDGWVRSVATALFHMRSWRSSSKFPAKSGYCLPIMVDSPCGAVSPALSDWTLRQWYALSRCWTCLQRPLELGIAR